MIVLRLSNDFIVKEEKKPVSNLPHSNNVRFNGDISVQFTIVPFVVLSQHILHALLLIVVRV
jgi:hypothetical protein